MKNSEKISNSKRFFIFSTILNLVLIISLCFYFDDEIKRLFKWSIGDVFSSHTMAENVTIHHNMAHFTTLNRKKTLRIYTPPTYNQSQKRYPVLYLMGSHSLFDAKNTRAGEWGVDETLNDAAMKGKQEVIVVAIEIGDHWLREMNPYNYKNRETNEAELLIDFIIKELKPLIDSKYRTLTDQKNTAIGGASLGGLFSFFTIMNHSDIFSKAIVLSPSFVYTEKVFELPKALKNKDIKIYMNVGEREFVGMVTVMKLMEKELKEAGFNEQTLKTKIVKDGGHDAKVWKEGFSEAYDFFITNQ